tara:strand:+ start:4164 stop:4757 length:594 start_codon:yes stop_codon:yes gene_type:complete
MEKDFNRERRELEKDLWELEKRQAMRSKFESILKLYSIFGIFIAVFGVAYFVISTLDIELNSSQQIALILSGTGLALSITSWALLVMRRERMNEEVNKLQSIHELSDFIWKWSKFEEIGKQVLIGRGVEFNRHSVREVISKLYEFELLEREDMITLDEAIEARNMAVHGGRFIPREMLNRYSLKMDDVISKLMSKIF